MFKDKVCVITGGANGIGKAICEEFNKQHAKCYVIDIEKGNHFVGDISNKETLEIDMVISKGKIVVKDGEAIIKGTFE